MALAKIRTIQPFKGAYVGLSLLDLVFLRVPLWSLRNLLPSWRPRRSWSILRCIQVHSLMYLMELGGQVGGLGHNPTHDNLETGKGVNGLYVDPVSDLFTGDVKKWAEAAGVESIKIPVYWQHKVGEEITMGAAPKENEKVILALHGGAYIGLSAHPSSGVSIIPRTIMASAPSVRRALSVEYRLARPGRNPFPSQLLDALAGYSYLVRTVGFKPEDIVIIGDSAGANLALALTRYLLTHAESLGDRLGLLGGLVLLSPWGDLTSSHATPGASVYVNARSDFIRPPPAKGPDYAPSVFVGFHGLEFLPNEYISPATRLNPNISFKGFPRSIIVIGGAESLLDSIRTLEERMVKDLGREKVTTYVGKDAIHDFIAFKFFEPERTEAAIAVGKWIEDL